MSNIIPYFESQQILVKVYGKLPKASGRTICIFLINSGPGRGGRYKASLLITKVRRECIDKDWSKFGFHDFGGLSNLDDSANMSKNICQLLISINKTQRKVQNACRVEKISQNNCLMFSENTTSKTKLKFYSFFKSSRRSTTVI